MKSARKILTPLFFPNSGTGWKLNAATQLRLNDALHQLEAEIDRIIGPDEQSDKPFTTPNGGLSNMGSNNCRNGLRTEQRQRLREFLGGQS